MKPEGKIQKAVKEYAESRGCLAMRRQAGPFGSNGFPDFQFLYQGRYLFIEFKAPGKCATELQLERHAQIRAHGGQVFVCDDTITGKRVIDQFVSQKRITGGSLQSQRA